jgi:glutamate-1-semialdehyde 2,1-aminomutase
VASPRSKAYFERAQSVMPGGVKGAYYYCPYPLSMERGDGCYLYDVDGRRYIDFTNHHTAQILGHNHTVVNSAIKAQVSRGIALGAPTGIEVELAEEMCRRVPSLDCIRFCNSGTEATLHAIRLARAFTGRPKIAKFEGAYHGSHDAVEISVSPPLEKAGPKSAPTAVASAAGIAPHAVDEIVILPYNDEAAVERLITDHRNELACVLFDPKPHAIPQRAGFVQFLEEILRKNNIIFILDEIVSFRLAPGGFQELCGITPDLTTYGKIIGGGFPVGGLGGRAEVMELLDSTGRGRGGLFQSGTFSAHPVVMAAGLATLQQLTADAYAHLDCLGERLRDEFENLFARKQISAQVAGMGSLFSIHFLDGEIRNYRDLARKNSAMAYNIFLSLLDKGFFLNSSLDFNALSLPMQERQVDELVGAVECAVEQFA